MVKAPTNSTPPVVTNPDPTDAVREALTLAIRNLEEKIDDRFEASDKAVKLAREELKTHLDTMLEGINDKFISNEKLVDQLGKANAVALGAALQTQEKSAAKSELSMTDLLRQLQTALEISIKAANDKIETSIKPVNEKVDRLTSRLDTGDGRVNFEDVNRRDYRSAAVTDKASTVSLVAVGISALALVALIVIELLKSGK